MPQVTETKAPATGCPPASITALASVPARACVIQTVPPAAARSGRPRAGGRGGFLVAARNPAANHLETSGSTRGPELATTLRFAGTPPTP